MTIEADPSAFPGCVVTALSAVIATIDPDLTLLQRPLRTSDPNQSVGVFALTMTPGVIEIGEEGPTTDPWNYQIQLFNKDSSDTNGLAVNSTFTRLVLNVLQRSILTRTVLTGLTSYDPVTSLFERMLRYKVEGAQLQANDLNGAKIFLSTIRFSLETERTSY